MEIYYAAGSFLLAIIAVVESYLLIRSGFRIFISNLLISLFEGIWGLVTIFFILFYSLSEPLLFLAVFYVFYMLTVGGVEFFIKSPKKNRKKIEIEEVSFKEMFDIVGKELEEELKEKKYLRAFIYFSFFANLIFALLAYRALEFLNIV